MKTIFHSCRIIRVALILSVAISFTSCKKYLDKKSDSKLVTLQTIQDYQALLDDALFMNLRHSPSFGESSADDYFIPQNIYNQMGAFQQQIYFWNPQPYFTGGDWTICFKSVYNCNLTLEGMDKIQPSSNEQAAWNNVTGSALFYRSYNFYDLACTFSKAYDAVTADSDLGIPLRLESDFNIPSVRASVRQTYDRILQDAKQASYLLPDLPEVTTRPSKCAAYGLLARVYLSMGIFDSAYQYANKCLAIKDNLHDYNSPNGLLVRFNDETIFYNEINSSMPYFSSSYGKADTALIAGYDINDKRLQVLFSGPGYLKFIGTYTNSRSTYFSGIATDEIYFIKAECCARMGNLPAAFDVLNTILEKRWTTGTFVPFTSGSVGEAINLILKERRKSLLMRGLRWMDIKRLNKLQSQITPTRLINGELFTLPPNDNRYALPIPADIIRLTGMPQN